MPRRSPARTRPRATSSRRNFLALMFCLMVGTAALPHILMRYYTTPRAAGARIGVLVAVLHLPAVLHGAGAGGAGEVRRLYVSVGSEFAKLPQWVAAWPKVDPTLLIIIDVNRDGIVQLAEIVDRRRHHRAGDPGNRGPALRDLGPGGGRRSGGGAIDRGRVAADDRQRAVARLLLQDDRPACLDGSGAWRSRRRCSWSWR